VPLFLAWTKPVKQGDFSKVGEKDLPGKRGCDRVMLMGNASNNKTLYTLRTDTESLDVLVCDKHAREMPAIDRVRVTAQMADADCVCEFCARSAWRKRRIAATVEGVIS
jgi:hypothetical protein